MFKIQNALKNDLRIRMTSKFNGVLMKGKGYDPRPPPTPFSTKEKKKRGASNFY